MYVAKLKGKILSNTIENTQQEVIERVQQLQVTRTSIKDRGFWREKYQSPSWESLQEDGYEVTELVLKEK